MLGEDYGEVFFFFFFEELGCVFCWDLVEGFPWLWVFFGGVISPMVCSYASCGPPGSGV